MLFAPKPRHVGESERHPGLLRLGLMLVIPSYSDHLFRPTALYFAQLPFQNDKKFNATKYHKNLQNKSNYNPAT